MKFPQIKFFLLALVFAFSFCSNAQSDSIPKKKKWQLDSAYKKVGNSLKNFKRKLDNAARTVDSVVMDTSKIRDKIKNIVAEINRSEKKKTNKDSLKTLVANSKDTSQAKPVEKNIATDYVEVGTLYMNMNKPAAAVSYYEKGLKAARASGSPEVTQIALKGLYDAYSKKADLKNALFYFQAYIQLRDSLYELQAEKIIHDLETENEIQLLQLDKQKKESDLAVSRAGEKKQKQILLLTVTILFFVLLLAFILFRQYKAKKKTNEQLSAQKTELEQLQEVLKDDLDRYMQLALRKQMNPHFIFNSLNSIQNFIMKNDKLEANIYLSKFASLMRKVLENSQHDTISLEKELEVLKLYIELEEQRFDKNFITEWKVSNDVILSAHFVPPLIFQPYVENAIWHGLLHKDGERKLIIAIEKKNDKLVCRIEDNGIGREAAAEIRRTKINHESLGMKITQKRIQLVNSLNKSGIEIKYTDLKDETGKANGTRVEIFIPVKEKITA